MLNRPTDHLLVANFACFLQWHRANEAEHLFQRAIALKPTHKGVNDMFARFKSMRSEHIRLAADHPH
jgi:hypothetical protein